MLEHQGLFLLPWAPAHHVTRRAILDSATGAPVGFVCRPPRPGRPWFVRLIQPEPVVLVHETEDESLLFTIHRRWTLRTRLEVRDANGQFVGKLCHVRRWGHEMMAFLRTRPGVFPAPGGGILAEDRLGRSLAVIDGVSGASQVQLVAHRRSATASWDVLTILGQSEEHAAVVFPHEIAGEPFIKMVLLAAVIVSGDE